MSRRLTPFSDELSSVRPFLNLVERETKGKSPNSRFHVETVPIEGFPCTAASFPLLCQGRS